MDLEEAKRLARRSWAAGDYGTLAPMIEGAAADLSRRAALRPGDLVLDVACGTGDATIPAALRGARVTGLDLTPELLDGARRRAEAADADVALVEGDAEALPFPDAGFDVVLSSFGCMFAPRHAVVAAEIARVLRPRGRIAIATWTPEGATDDFFRVLAPLFPPPRDDAEPPMLRGDEGHVRALFAGTGVRPEFDRAEVVLRFPSVDEAIATYWGRFGPLVVARERIADGAALAETRTGLAALFARATVAGGRVELPAEYLVITGRKA
ncbi:MAG: methyltransferase domain-containing protein [Thermoleophilia bacterium]|nr:methyltransferase domain-containing protein [Thermoleophilia bacterium]